MRILTYIALLLIMLMAHLRMLPYAADDAYIHFRIAENWLQFGIPYFNLNSALLTSSSPLWTIVLGLLAQITNQLPLVVALLNAIILSGSIYVYYLFAKRLAKDHKGIVLFLLTAVLVLACTLEASLSLMETPLAVLLFGMNLLSLDRKQYARSVFYLVLASFTRPEFSCALLLNSVYLVWQSRLSIYRTALSILVAAVIPCVFCIYYFGTLIPQTIHAKSIVYGLTPTETLHQLVYLFFGDSFFGKNSSMIAYLLAMLAAVGLLARQQQKQGPSQNPPMELMIFVLAPGLCIALAYILRGVHIFPWYMPLVTLPLVYFLFLIGLWKGCRRTVLLTFVFASPLLIRLGLDCYSMASQRARYALFLDGARVRKYRQVGTAIAGCWPGASLMASEIGGLGYEFRGEINDALGLASADALEFHPLRIPTQRSSHHVGAIPLAYIQARKPDLIVSVPSFLEKSALDQLAAEYESFESAPFIHEDVKLFEQTHGALTAKLYILKRRDLLDLDTGFCRDYLKLSGRDG